jgi:hypothetical protein
MCSRYADVRAGDFAPDRLRRAALFMTGGVNQLVEDWLASTITLTTEELATECARMATDVVKHTQA